MRLAPRSWPWTAGLLCGMAVPTSAQDKPAQPPAPVQDAPLPTPPPFAPMSLKPLPPVPIPDDPPPHEGALYDFPLTIQPPDILVVEVLDALPGRAITGEHLVRPDGTISLGFYGDVHVRGLTVAQAKTKIILQLRRHLTDMALGLVAIKAMAEPSLTPMPDAGVPAPDPAGPKPEPAPQPSPDAKPASAPKDLARTQRPPSPSTRRVSRLVAQGPAPTPPTTTSPRPLGPELDDDLGAAIQANPLQDLGGGPEAGVMAITPDQSNRVFVEITSYNSQVYFVQGDVGTPGRLPFTGRETVLDALNYAGGFTSQAEPTDLHLYRPARGGAPVRDYRIDHAAILRGDARANLQIFPGDRLVVGRNAVVAQTIRIDQALAPFNSILNAAFQAAITTRAIGSAGGDINGTNQTDRDAALRRYFNLLRDLPDTPGKPSDVRPLLDVPLLPVRPRPTGEPGDPPGPGGDPKPR